jgi:ABC-type glycerol-3-phosphate transport system permease component
MTEKRAKPHKNRLETKRTGFTLVLFILVFLFFAVYAFSLLYPIAWGLMSSLKTPREYINVNKLFPAKLMFSNYAEAWKNLSYEGTTFLEMTWNSVWFSVGSTVISIFFLTLTSYIIAKYEFRGRKLLYGMVVFAMIMPSYGTFSTQYSLYYKLGWANSYLILLSATGVLGMNFIIMSAYFRNISSSYAEAARIDGAGHWRVFFSVMMPLAMPMVASFFLLGFIGKWNDYMAPLLYLPKMLTLATGLFKYQEIAERTGSYPMLFAGLFIVMVPIILIFTLLSNTMMKNMTFGGLKG